LPEKIHLNEKQTWLQRLRLSASVGAASLAFLASGIDSNPASAEERVPAQVESTPDLIIAFQEDQMVNENSEMSLKIAEAISHLDDADDDDGELLDNPEIELGAKATGPWSFPDQCSEINNDTNRYTNFFRATRDYGLTPILNIIPGSTGLSKIPITHSQRRCFKDTAVSYIHLFASVYKEKGEDDNDGYSDEESKPTMYLEVFNEVNSEAFAPNQYDRNGNWVMPKHIVRATDVVYRGSKQAAAKLDVNVEMITPGLHSQNRALDFFSTMGRYKKELGIKNQITNCFSWHPYGSENNEPPDTIHPNLSTIGLADYNTLLKIIDISFIRQDYPICASEYGVKALIPPDKKYLYPGVTQTSSTLVSEDLQTRFYTKSLKMARCSERLLMWTLFNAVDDPDGAWTSGIWRPIVSINDSLEAKPAYEPLHQTITSIKSGNFSC